MDLFVHRGLMSLSLPSGGELGLAVRANIGTGLDVRGLYVPLNVPLVSVVLLAEAAGPVLHASRVHVTAGLLLYEGSHLVLLHKY